MNKYSEIQLIGKSTAMGVLAQKIRQAARSSAPILMIGETGTGKELYARALHQQSAHMAGPFISLNCAALSHDAIADIIFGDNKIKGGVLFLDHIDQMDRFLQAKLSQALKEIAPPNCPRILCATERPIDHLLGRGFIQPDLFYCLSAGIIDVPPLRMRRDDIPDLSYHFLGHIAQQEQKNVTHITGQAMTAMRDYAWPGNIRQLENAIRHAVVFHPGPVVTKSMLPAAVVTPYAYVVSNWHYTQEPANGSRPSLHEPDTNVSRYTGRSLAHIERDAITAALEVCGGNIPAAAAMLDISPSTIYRKRDAWKK